MKMTAKQAYEFSLRENNKSYRFLDDLFNKKLPIRQNLEC